MSGCQSRCSCTVVLATRQRNRWWTRTQLFTEPVRAGAASGIAAGSVDDRLTGFTPSRVRIPHPPPLCSRVAVLLTLTLPGLARQGKPTRRTVATMVTTTAVGGGSPDRARDPDRTFLGPDAVVAQPAGPAACVSANRVWQRRGIAVGDRGGACLGQPRSWGVRLGMGNTPDDPARRRWPHSDPA